MMAIMPAFVSLPSHAEKRALVVPRLRAPGMVRWARSKNRDAVGISELASISALYIRLALGLGLVTAKPNNKFGTNVICNALMYREWIYTVVRSHSIPVPMPNHQFGEINMLAVLLENRQTGQRIWYIVWHAPRKKLDPHTNVQARLAVIREAKRLFQATKHDVVTLGDSNDRRALRVFRRCGFDIGAEDEVTMIASLGDVRWMSPDVAENVKWSDHVALYVNGRAGRKKKANA